jgi:hypothetical protein
MNQAQNLECRPFFRFARRPGKKNFSLRHLSQSLAGLLMLIAGIASAQAGPGGTTSLSVAEQQCYAMSMVGYDSVINSRLGVPAEHALDLAAIKRANTQTAQKYAPFLLKVILDAYLWIDSPHTYAVKTMFNCASQHSETHTALNGTADIINTP